MEYMHDPFLNTLKCTYAGFECAVQVDGYCTHWFNVSNGVQKIAATYPQKYDIILVVHKDWYLNLINDDHNLHFLKCGNDLIQYYQVLRTACGLIYTLTLKKWLAE
jgi:hypothetical protein